MRKLSKIIATLCVIGVVGCKKVPDDIIAPDDMAELIADLYTAESVVDINRVRFASDSMRKVLKQSIYLNHGVTSAQVDSSFMWYGRNIDEYVEVQDKVIEILERRMSGSSSAGSIAGMGVAGDSVDTWQGAHQYVISRRSPSQIITFSIDADENSEPGDQYVWAVKSLNMRQPSTWAIAADYEDGSTDYHNGQVNGDGWNRLSFTTDTARVVKRLYGYLLTNPVEGEEIYVDSVSLTRRRLDLSTYHQRLRQRTVGRSLIKPKNSSADTITEDEGVNIMSPTTVMESMHRRGHRRVEPTMSQTTNSNSSPMKAMAQPAFPAAPRPEKANTHAPARR